MKTRGYLHVFCAAITLWFVALGLYRFFDSVGRIIEAGMDLGLSVAYYFCELFGVEHSVVPTVNEYPKIPFFDGLGGAFAPQTSLPETFEGFFAKWSEYWRTWATMENFQGYCAQLVWIMYFVAVGLLIIFAMPFQVMWSYFAWMNQTLAAVTLWMIVAYFARQRRGLMVGLIPALIMTYVCASYIFVSPLMFGMQHRTAAYILGGAVTLAILIAMIFKVRRDHAKGLA